ncbi:MAG: hypothetical protein EBT92_03990 [Planctomycetes bacterium]|nr:hypothetical protein [Planctomycetota bacterium]
MAKTPHGFFYAPIQTLNPCSFLSISFSFFFSITQPSSAGRGQPRFASRDVGFANTFRLLMRLV